jgi:hypothetical protein
MPTEFLPRSLSTAASALACAIYWDVMGRSPTVAGGFFWAFADGGHRALGS